MKPRVVLPITVFLVGVVVALAFIARKPREVNPKKAPTPASNQKEAVSQRSIVDDNAPVARASQEPDTGEKKKESPDSSPTDSVKEGALKRTETLLSEVFKAIDDGDDKRQIALFARFGELSPEVVPFLSEKYSAEKDGAKAGTILQMIYAAGGDHLSAFLKDRLLNPATSSDETRRILGVMGNPNHEVNALYAFRAYQVDDELKGKAITEYASSATWQHRAGAARILGFSARSPETHEKLVQLAYDNDVHVRASAILALGKIGDANTLKVLENYQYPPDDGMNYLLKGALRDAMLKLAQK